MMIRLLSLLLVLQAGLALYLYWPQDSARETREALLSLDSGDVARLTVSDGTASVTLQRSGDDWLLPGALPADPLRVTALLQALTSQPPGYAIATSATAARRFEVAEDAYQRRVEISAGDGADTVYLGTSPAFRKIHARRAGEEAIFRLDLNSYDAPTSAASWLDRGLAAVTGITAVSVDGRDFVLDGEQWLDAAGTAVDADAMGELVQALSSLQVTGLANEEDQGLAESGEQRLQLAARSAAAVTELTLGANNERYFLRSSDYEALFTISAYDAEQLLDAVRAVVAKPAPEGEDADTGEETPAPGDQAPPR